MPQEEEQVEREPTPEASPTSVRSLQQKRHTTHSDGTAPVQSPTDAVRPLLLLEHAFGKRMLEGKDEWRDVADVIRSSFLVVAKELKRQEKRLRVLETTQQSSHTAAKVVHNQEEEGEDRWSVMQTQLKLFNEELQLLTQELQHVRANEMVLHEKAVKQHVATQLETHSRRAQERHARLKQKVARLNHELEAEAVSHGELDVKVASLGRAVKDQIHAQNMVMEVVKRELRVVTPKVDELEARLGEISTQIAGGEGTETNPQAPLRANPATTQMTPIVPTEERNLNRDALHELLHVQAQCQQEIKRLQFALAAHDHRAMQQSKEMKKSVAAAMEQTSATTAREVKEKSSRIATKKSTTSISPAGAQPFASKGLERVDTEIREKAQKRRMPSLDVDASDETHFEAAGSTGTHATLRQRFADARQKQQECLTQLRQQQPY